MPRSGDDRIPRCNQTVCRFNTAKKIFVRRKPTWLIEDALPSKGVQNQEYGYFYPYSDYHRNHLNVLINLVLGLLNVSQADQSLGCTQTGHKDRRLMSLFVGEKKLPGRKRCYQAEPFTNAKKYKGESHFRSALAFVRLFAPTTE